jgi:hypothetical protein
MIFCAKQLFFADGSTDLIIVDTAGKSSEQINRFPTSTYNTAVSYRYYERRDFECTLQEESY